MADRWAVANGNWSSTATWDGGTLPQAGDDVYADGKTVTVDQNVTVANLRTSQRSGGTAGGYFNIGANDLTVNADLRAGTTHCLSIGNYTGTIVNGNVYGGTATQAYGLNSYTCPCTLNGNSYGGTGYQSFGAHLRNCSIQNGDSYGGTGTGSGASGTYMEYFCVQNGNAYGGTSTNNPCVGSQLLYECILNGDSTGGSGTSNNHGANLSTGSVQYGDSYGGTTGSCYGTYLAFSRQYGNAVGGSASFACGTYMHQGTFFQGAATGGSVSNAHGVSGYDSYSVVCSLATGTVSGAYGVNETSSSNTGLMVIEATSGSYPHNTISTRRITSIEGFEQFLLPEATGSAPPSMNGGFSN